MESAVSFRGVRHQKFAQEAKSLGRSFDQDNVIVEVTNHNMGSRVTGDVIGDDVIGPTPIILIIHYRKYSFTRPSSQTALSL